jgi:hypothetical protein
VSGLIERRLLEVNPTGRAGRRSYCRPGIPAYLREPSGNLQNDFSPDSMIGYGIGRE